MWRKRLGLQQHMIGKYLIVERREACKVVPRSDAKVNTADAHQPPDAMVRTHDNATIHGGYRYGWS